MASRKGLGRGLEIIIPKYENNDEEPVSKETGAESEKPKKAEKDKSGAGRTGSAKAAGSGKTSGQAAAGGKTSAEKRSAKEEAGPVMLRIAEVEPNRSQPRRDFNEDALQELADSIRQHGVLQPVIVQKRDKYYEIIAGERRWRAARMAGLKEIPVIIRDLSDKEILELSLIENIQREDLNPIEEAQAFERLLEEFHLTQDELAERVSRSRSSITNTIRLLKLAPDVRQMLIDEKLSAGHARALLAIEDPEVQLQAAQQIFDEKLSVRETEKLVKQLTQGTEKKKGTYVPSEAVRLAYEDMERQLKEALGTRVKVHYSSNKRGRLEIEYYSGEELERLYAMLRNCAAEVTIHGLTGRE